ncbi:cupredoxin domain-containing protein [Kribbella solani]|uniref:Plastocyanin n=1 Tax=Kribbella solani TaxID=236067 RepID=A0A841DUJ3_9ACTN|nr:cupredoxin domain-containing protein [Kribbella solani]MBB5980436.1 plastocyanin [Kribbella solani]MDX2972121.1 cupredoxin domain-containing protein [Kribbella solani]MDX3004398.1 cupredoxin domain-containing protein [Kribbella solani]
MRSTLTRGAATALLPTLGMLVLAGCGGGDSSSGSDSPSPVPGSPFVTPPPSSPAPSSGAPSSSGTPGAEQADVKIDITVANGKVNPSGATIKVKAGQTVLVTAISDADEELHIHGYDKELELTPGKSASVKFTANMKGTFEVETHKSAKLVAKLVVS